jgi:hypothetical protein
MLSNSLFFAAVLVLVIFSIQYAGLVVTIRQYYEDYYESIGKPPALFITPLNAGAAWSFMTYVVLGEFKDDKPPEQILGSLRVARVLLLLALSLLALALAASFL